MAGAKLWSQRAEWKRTPLKALNAGRSGMTGLARAPVATWALVHGLAFLHLDGKLDTPTPTAVADRVTAAIRALLSTTIHDGDMVGS
jgi:hypothetical protein